VNIAQIIEGNEGSLDSLLSVSGSSLESSPNSIGSDFMQRLDLMTMKRVHIGEKKLLKEKKKHGDNKDTHLHQI